MLIYELIHNDIRPLKRSNTIGDAVAVMEHENMHYYPIVDEDTKQFVGQASLDDYSTVNSDVTSYIETGIGIGNVLLDSNHVLEAAHILLRNERTSLPVINRSGSYLGIVTKTHLVEAITHLLNLKEVGTVIMIEMKPVDFMLSDVIRIIESEGARIMSLTVQTPDAIVENFRISVKLNLDDLSRVGAALRRYGYLIISESNTELSDTELSAKADEFLRYLDI